MQAGQNFHIFATLFACLHDNLGTVFQSDVIHSRTAINCFARRKNRFALSGCHIDTCALADEVIAEPLDIDIGNDAAAWISG